MAPESERAMVDSSAVCGPSGSTDSARSGGRANAATEARWNHPRWRLILSDRLAAITTAVHARDYLINQKGDFLGRFNAVEVLTDGIINAVDPLATGGEWRTVRHLWRKQDGNNLPIPTDARCQYCGIADPTPFTLCDAANHAAEDSPESARPITYD